MIQSNVFDGKFSSVAFILEKLTLLASNSFLFLVANRMHVSDTSIPLTLLPGLDRAIEKSPSPHPTSSIF